MNTQVVQFQPAVENYGSRSLTAADIRAQVNLMQDVMQEVMIKDTHFGVIPGTGKPTLYKAGAEKIMSTFRIAADPEVTDLSRDGEIHYRVKVSMLSSNGTFLGAGIGECSSGEDKYSWRAAVCDEEFDDTPENRRRIKYAKWKGNIERKKQVRTNPADVSNTILKMAKKRGLIDGVLTVTAASDLFTQDIEDLPAEVAAEIVAQPEVDQDAQRKAQHDEALGRHSESVAYIKERIGEDDMETAYKEWQAISTDDQRALWLATSKGGCFTTDERKAIKEYKPTPTGETA